MKPIPFFIDLFGIKNIELVKLFEAKGHTLSETQIYQKKKINYKYNRFNKHELRLLAEIEKEFLNELRQKFVTYKALKFREDERLRTT